MASSGCDKVRGSGVRTLTRSRPVQAFALIAAVTSAQTTAQRPEKNWSQVCARSTAAPLTPSFAHVEAESNLPHCDSTALYYGFDHPADWAAALQCAYWQRAHPRPSEGHPFYGPGVLTTLYANGRAWRAATTLPFASPVKTLGLQRLKWSCVSATWNTFARLTRR